jgi:predicted transcriptional regulator
MSVTIRVSSKTHKHLRRLAVARQQPIGEVIAAAVARLESDRFWDEMEAAFEQLYADPAAAAAYESERREWDVTLLDGLEHEPPSDEEGEA